MIPVVFAIGVLLAIGGAVLTALGAQRQNRGVDRADDSGGAKAGELGLRRILRMFRDPTWLTGVLAQGGGVVANLVALRLAPLVVVQPLGVVSMVTAVLLDARERRVRLSRGAILSVLACVVGVAAFVLTGTVTARNDAPTDTDLGNILLVLAGEAVLILLAQFTLRRAIPVAVDIASAGLLSGSVVTLAKSVITRLTTGQIDWITLLGVVVLVVAAVSQGYFVQRAYAGGSFDVVVAGLTILDPVVAVALGAILLGEIASTPPWALVVYALAAALAIGGVVALSRTRPPRPPAPIGTTGASAKPANG